MSKLPTIVAVLAAGIGFTTAVFAQEATYRNPSEVQSTLADHPAVAVQRMLPTQGYDYASKFYPHAAWLYLYPEAPDVIAAKRPQRQQQDALAHAAAPKPTGDARL
jgi:hypothetical protein